MESSACEQPQQIELLTKRLELLKRQWLRQYDRNINKDLSRQNTQQLMLRNVQLTFDGFLEELTTQFRAGELGDISTEQLLEQLSGFPEAFLTEVLKKHRTSCAMSNFPEEHNPHGEYLETVILAVEQRWEGFGEKSVEK